ncbi:MAG: hypothetical protein JSV37_10520 [Anaerolineaceae bacterium]|nr:MAG: hypothetical protein JSV37_10520 [Anaerolineaceae bacterium]
MNCPYIFKKDVQLLPPRELYARGEVIQQYASYDLGFVDCSLVLVALRLFISYRQQLT